MGNSVRGGHKVDPGDQNARMQRSNSMHRILVDEATDRKIQDDYYILQQIGEPGAFGCAKVAIHKETKEKVVVKIIAKENFRADTETLDMFYREAQILTTVRHQNIVEGKDLYEDDDYIYLVMEYCGGGELFDRIRAKKRFSEADAALILRQVFKAVKCLHDNQIAHCDLKPDNLLFKDSSDNCIKIIDFNYSRFVAPLKNIKKGVGTLYYMAPEVIDHNYTIHCDMWSLGVIMFVMLFGVFPFNASNQADIYPKIQRGVYTFPKHITVSDSAKDLISKLLVRNPTHRLSAVEALEHPWLTEDAPVESLATLMVGEALPFLTNRQITDRQLQDVLLPLAGQSGLPEADISHLQEAFVAADTDCDGFIRLSDLRRVLVEMDARDQQIANRRGSAPRGSPFARDNTAKVSILSSLEISPSRVPAGYGLARSLDENEAPSPLRSAAGANPLGRPKPVAGPRNDRKSVTTINVGMPLSVFAGMDGGAGTGSSLGRRGSLPELVSSPKHGGVEDGKVAGSGFSFESPPRPLERRLSGSAVTSPRNSVTAKQGLPPRPAFTFPSIDSNSHSNSQSRRTHGRRASGGDAHRESGASQEITNAAFQEADWVEGSDSCSSGRRLGEVARVPQGTEDHDLLISWQMVLRATARKRLTGKAERLQALFHALDRGSKGHLTLSDLEVKLGAHEGLADMMGEFSNHILTLDDFMTVFLGDDYEDQTEFKSLADSDLERRKSRSRPGSRAGSRRGSPVILSQDVAHAIKNDKGSISPIRLPRGAAADYIYNTPEVPVKTRTGLEKRGEKVVVQLALESAGDLTGGPGKGERNGLSGSEKSDNKETRNFLKRLMNRTAEAFSKDKKGTDPAKSPVPKDLPKAPSLRSPQKVAGVRSPPGQAPKGLTSPGPKDEAQPLAVRPGNFHGHPPRGVRNVTPQ